MSIRSEYRNKVSSHYYAIEKFWKKEKQEV